MNIYKLVKFTVYCIGIFTYCTCNVFELEDISADKNDP